MDSMRRNAQKMMPHIMALNKNPTMGMKNDRQPTPAVSKLVAYAKGGKVEGGKSDKAQDKAMMARHNRLMHPGQKSKLAKGGKAKGDKKKVMGTVGEAKAVMAALKKARRPATPMPGAAGLGMSPAMAPPMKRGGKVMKRAAGGAAKLRKKSPMPDKIKKVPYVNGG